MLLPLPDPYLCTWCEDLKIRPILYYSCKNSPIILNGEDLGPLGPLVYVSIFLYFSIPAYPAHVPHHPENVVKLENLGVFRIFSMVRCKYGLECLLCSGLATWPRKISSLPAKCDNCYFPLPVFKTGKCRRHVAFAAPAFSVK